MRCQNCLSTQFSKVLGLDTIYQDSLIKKIGKVALAALLGGALGFGIGFGIGLAGCSAGLIPTPFMCAGEG